MADAFSLIQFKDLPTFTGTLSENATLVAVLDNTRTVRIDWDILNSGLIRGSADQPSSPYSSGEQGNLYVGSTGLYSYSDGSWGKSPRYTENWDDLAPGVRFLRVDGLQALSSTEKSHALANIGVAPIANAESAGLVKAWGSTSWFTLGSPVIINDDGTQYVTKATEGSLGVVDLAEVATRSYVDSAIAASIVSPENWHLPIATSTVPGAVLSDTPLEDGGDGVFSVGADGKVTIRPASLYRYEETEEGTKVTGGLPGIYSVTAVDDVRALDYAPTLGLVKTLVGSGGGLSYIPVATPTQVGGVRAWSTYTANIPTTAALVVTTTDGYQFVRTADSDITGTVRTIDDGSDVTNDFGEARSFIVPTVGAMVSFVSDNFPELDAKGKVSASNLPSATSEDAGIIKGSSTVNIDSYGEAYVPDATVSSKGVVRLATANASGELSNDSGVTTASQVINHVNYILGSGPYVSTNTYNTYVTETDASIQTVENSLTALTNNVNTINSDVSALKNAESGEAFLSTASTVIEAVKGWVKYTGVAGRLVTFNGVVDAGYVATLTFQTEVPVTFGDNITWEDGFVPTNMDATKGYVLQIISFPGPTEKLGRKIMEYTLPSTT